MGREKMLSQNSGLKLILLILAAGLFLAGCTTRGPSDASSTTRATETRPPMRTGAIPPGARGEVPTLSDLFGRFQEEEIRIALLLPLSGPSENVGQAFLDAASMALFESFDPRLHLFPYDTLGTPQGARRAALEAIDEDADIVVGPLFSDSIRALSPIVREEGLKLIGFSNDPNVGGNGIYLLSFLPEQEVERVISYAAREGYRDFAALIPDTPYGEAVLEGFSQAVSASIGEIAALEIYERNTQAFFEPVRRLANYDQRREAYLEEQRFLENFENDDLAQELLEKLEPLETIGPPPFDSVLVPESGRLLRSLVPLLPFFEVDPEEVKFLGTGLWYDPTLPGEPTLTGAWFAGANPETVENFMGRFRSLYGYRPPRITTLAYDAVALVASLSRIEIRAQRFSDTTFQNANGFRGIDGIFRFRPDGTTRRGLAILEITRNGFEVIDPAPQSFVDLPRP